MDQARERSATLRRSLDEMGPVNIGAIEEYRELETRYQFLTSQETDLTTSMESLRQAIAKINKTTQSLFTDTFHLLNEKFKQVFVSFFGGGKAELILLDEAHPLESGIEMVAQPPGKKPRSITLLSGGEKALTAISLLFATFLIHPSPFCLLDEIDAPLDEENTRRFIKAIDDMSQQTQFIVITHNKRTMEIADVLYGVTMEETGLSRLISVDLNEKQGANGNGHPVGTPVTSDSI
ncbi:MAG: AAA family ATPase [Candidatus Manganitrophus sp.]|nr:AAA family ATPase [Candidatus Manganitrophus sp.]